MIAPSEREQLRALLLRIWRATEPRSDVRRSMRLAASGWRRHIEHRERPGYVAGSGAIDLGAFPLWRERELDQLGDAIIAEHGALIAFHGTAVEYVRVISRRPADVWTKVEQQVSITALRMLAGVALELVSLVRLRDEGEGPIAELTLDNLLDILAEGLPPALWDEGTE